MKRIKFILLAITMLLAVPAFFTSCQEDAPEINYTMNVSVINDFTKVVEAINNGSLKNEEAINKLTEAIDKMNAGQQAKLQAIIDVLNAVNATLETKLALIEAAMQAQTLTLESKLALLETAIKNQTIKQEEMAAKLATAIDNLSSTMEAKLDAIEAAINDVNTTLETKLALIEAAMQAQTLSLEGKLDLLEAAIKALPDYTSQLEAIKTAIAALPDYGDKLTAIENAIRVLPDYNDKFDAVVAALTAMKTQIEALGDGQTAIATKIGEVTTAINNLIDEVEDGNTSTAAALAQIIAKLEELKAAIGGGTTPSTMEYVDLGLPSGLKWAKCNLGASKPSDYGDYYAWGETTTKTEYSWDTYKWGTENNLTKYNDTDGKTTLDPEDDAATAKLGAPWRMPTSDELEELQDKCFWTWTTQDGVDGYKFEGPNGNTIFLPGAGGHDASGLDGAGQWLYLWSSSQATGYSSNYALFLRLGPVFSPQCYYTNRCRGLPIRPVRP